jgi:tRNA A-37 threonylcarbamoyl transferase component Bud32
MPGPGRVQIVKVAAGEDAAAWATALAALEISAARVLKDDAGAGVYSAEVLGRRVVLKWRALSGVDRLKALLGAGRALRHWRGALWLEARGIRTARCFAIARDAGGTREWLAMEELAGETLLEVLAEGHSVKEQHALAREVGRVLGAIEAGGRANRDSKPSNLFVLDGPGNKWPRIAVIDCIAVRPLPLVGRARALARMHASAVIEPMGCGIAIRRALLMSGLLATFSPMTRARRRDERNRRWLAVRRIVEGHGDPTPRVNPLAGMPPPPRPPGEYGRR